MDEEMKPYAPNAEDATTIAHNASRIVQDLVELLVGKGVLSAEERGELWAHFEPRKD